jgi:hypothetical protein
MKKLIGRFISGIAWGAGTALVLGMVRSDHGNPKQVARGLMRQLLGAAESLAESRESLEDLYAEARAERDASLDRVEA